LNIGVADNACEGIWLLNMNGDSSDYKRLPVVWYELADYSTSLTVNNGESINVETGSLMHPVLVCLDDLPVSGHTLTVSIVATDPLADPLLLVSPTELILDSDAPCDLIWIDASNANAIVDRTADLMITPSSTSDMMIVPYSS